ncbi:MULTISPECIES: energy transducer TonB [Qipengyuania]
MSMGASMLRKEEKTGLLVALGLHLLILVALFVQGLLPAPTFEKPERMTVSLAEDVGLEATAPDPVAESRAATAPTISDAPAPAPDQPAPRETTAPAPRVQSPVPAPTARPDNRERRRPDPPRTQTPPRKQDKGGGSRLGDNFLEGSGSSTTTSETRVPASQIGASAKASLVQAIARRIKPKWQPPSGPDVDRITTYLRFRLNPDGSLAGRPTVVRQTGINDTNRAQAERHAEQAIRAVQLAAPFTDLPPEFYEAWKLVGPFGFDWRLAQ